MTLRQLIQSTPARDGAGVNISRIAGETVHDLLDPFLMIDEIRSEEQEDYMAGFPTHPHRGFETITYLLSGSITHEDHLGNKKTMTDGGVQWMTTGRGILHSEMPAQTEGLFHGLQIWLNLPSELKMTEPAYRDLEVDQLVVVEGNQAKLKLITGTLSCNGAWVSAEPATPSRTSPVIADLLLEPGAAVELATEADRKLLVYVFAGSEAQIERGQVAIYQPGNAVLHSGQEGLRALILAGEPLQEPIVQHGPFVMNTRQQIEEAVQDYNAGRLTA